MVTKICIIWIKNIANIVKYYYNLKQLFFFYFNIIISILWWMERSEEQHLFQTFYFKYN